MKLCAAKRAGRQDELPVMPARKKQDELPKLARTHVWIEDAGELVVGRRLAGGLFGGLWELPDVDAAERLGVTIDRTPVTHLAQVLTHRRLEVTVVRGRGLARTTDPGYEAIKRVRIADLETLGVAAVTIAILRQYQDSPWTPIPRLSPSSSRATRRSSKASASSASTSPTTTSRTPPRAPRKGSTSSSSTKGPLARK
jgi:hypothetical protein